MNKTEPVYVTLKNVRLSYPALFEPKTFAGAEATSKPAYSASVLLDKKANKVEIAAVQAGIASLVKSDLKGKHPGPSKVCLREGSEKPDTDGYSADNMFVGARNETRPTVVDRDLTPLVAADGKPYAGCYVNAVIRLWAQDNKFGKRVNASLAKVQFLKDGEPFGGSTVPADKDLVAVEDDEGSVV